MIRASGAASGRWILYGFLAILSILFFAAAYGSSNPWINQDVAMNLFSGLQILKGSRLYLDWHDTNPPGIHILSTGIAAIAQMTGVSLVAIAHGFLVVLAALAGEALLETLRERSRSGVLVLLGFLLFLICPTLLGPEQLGQREQLFVLFFFPFLIWKLTSGELAGAKLQWAAFFLGWFSGFKPTFLVLVCAVEWIGSRPRERTPPSLRIAFFVGLVTPLVLLIGVSPESFPAMVSDAIQAIRYYWTGGNGTLREGFTTSWAMAAHSVSGLLLLCVGWGTLRRSIALRQGATVFVVLSLAYASVFLQRKYLDYHWIPAIGLGFLCSVWLLSAYLAPRKLKLALLGFLLVLLAGGTFGLNALLRAGKPFPFTALFTVHKKIMLFSTSIWEIRPAVLQGVELVGPWFMHYTLPGIIRLQDPQAKSKELTKYRDELNRRIRAERPEMILFVETEKWFLPTDQTIHRIVADAGVTLPAEYRELSEQDLLGCCGGLHGWRIYRRN